MVSSLISAGSSVSSRTQGSQAFYPVVIAGSQCKPDQQTYLENDGMDRRSHFIAGTRSGTDIGERTWVKSSDLYRGQSSSACVSAEKAARETAVSCRRSLPSANRAIKRVSWQTAEPWITGPWQLSPGRSARRRVIDTATGKDNRTIVSLYPTQSPPRPDRAAAPGHAACWRRLPRPRCP